ncbi:helix-turn-helix transcriptional regulator [Akkermansia muciniphila]|nr:helix-turn-helix transcriptional regulator [Candidatus Akkermansia timonensis]MBT9563616.1 helix-turn-helix transcriptional regulator [Candidatus Akkermansia timonensis]
MAVGSCVVEIIMLDVCFVTHDCVTRYKNELTSVLTYMQEKSLQLGQFSKRLKYAIKQKRITQRELAQRVNISPVTISRYMSLDVQTPGAWELYRIANALDVSMEWLLTGDNPPNATKWQQRATIAEAKLESFKLGLRNLTETVSSLTQIITD